jgi:hypothetical protein
MLSLRAMCRPREIAFFGMLALSIAGAIGYGLPQCAGSCSIFGVVAFAIASPF